MNSRPGSISKVVITTPQPLRQDFNKQDSCWFAVSLQTGFLSML
jgi:hypothetical protein